MPKCSLCKKKCGMLTFTCIGCDKVHCVNHQLPEAHTCAGLDKIKAEEHMTLQKCLMSNLDAQECKKNYVHM